MRILLLADIHGNFPALQAVERHFASLPFDLVINCGDSIVYAPFPNEVISRLRALKAVSILGNTDKKVLKLLQGKPLKKPRKPEKLVMYTHTAGLLTPESRRYLEQLDISADIRLPQSLHSPPAPPQLLGVFHGSPDKPHEFLFATTPLSRFVELAHGHQYRIIVTGHSHSPYHHHVAGSHFINPGSVGRMFDSNPAASCAVLEITGSSIQVRHYRISYPVEQVLGRLIHFTLPPVYQTMYARGEKLN